MPGADEGDPWNEPACLTSRAWDLPASPPGATLARDGRRASAAIPRNLGDGRSQADGAERPRTRRLAPSLLGVVAHLFGVGRLVAERLVSRPAGPADAAPGEAR